MVQIIICEGPISLSGRARTQRVRLDSPADAEWILAAADFVLAVGECSFPVCTLHHMDRYSSLEDIPSLP